MDPNATWRELAESYGADMEQAEELAHALLYRLGRSDFPPEITDKREFDRFIAWSTCLAIVE